MSEALKEELKKVGLEIAEEHAKVAVDDVYKLAKVFVDSTESPIDNTILAGLELLKDELKKLADKINPED